MLKKSLLILALLLVFILSIQSVSTQPGCLPDYSGCDSDSLCCSGSCDPYWYYCLPSATTTTTPGNCLPDHALCNFDLECCSNYCDPTYQSCLPNPSATTTTIPPPPIVTTTTTVSCTCDYAICSLGCPLAGALCRLTTDCQGKCGCINNHCSEGCANAGKYCSHYSHCSLTTTTIRPSTTTRLSTTTTAQSTTTSTLPPQFKFECKECEARIKCECELTTTCEEGIWILKNKEGKPLLYPVVEDIPPTKVEYTPNTPGNIDVIGICFNPEPIKSNKTTVEVKMGFLFCIPECQKDSECRCVIFGCNSGLYMARQEGNILNSSDIIKTPFEVSFISTKAGDVEVSASCSNPPKPLTKTKVKVVAPIVTTTTTAAITTTQPPTTTTMSTTTTFPLTTTRTMSTTTTFPPTAITTIRPSTTTIKGECRVDSDCLGNEECVNRICTPKKKEYAWVFILLAVITVILLLVFFVFQKKPQKSFGSLYRKWEG